MASIISKYKTPYNEPATKATLAHMFMVLNNKNDKQIVFRDFAVHIENMGLPFDMKQQRKVYDTIARCVKKGRAITKDSWVKGIEIAEQHPNVRATYAAILGGKQYDPQPGREEIDLDEIRIKLQDLKAPWMYRVECMQSLCRQLTNKAVATDKFHELFRQYHISLTRQAKDRRSNVSRVACEAFSKIILYWGNEFLKYAYTTIEYLFELVRQKIAIVHQSGYNALVVLLKNCGDHKHCKMMDIFGREGTTSKFENLKKDCFDLLLLYLHEQSVELKSKKEFWSKLMEYTKKGVNDTAEVRNSALTLLAHIQAERSEVVKPVINAMGIHLRKRYDTQYRLIDGKPGGLALINTDQKSDDDWGELPASKIKRPKSARGSGGMKKSFTPVPSNRKNRSSTTAYAVPKTPPAPRPRSRTKGKPSHVSFPKAKRGEFLNGFGESLNEEDMQFAFEFIDFKKDRKITIDEFEVACNRLNVSGNRQELFAVLLGGNQTGYVQIQRFRNAIATRDPKLMNFWERLLSGKGLECAPLANGDMEFDAANKVLMNLKNNADDRLRAMYSITRRICGLKKYDISQNFEKQFKKSMSPFVNQLKDRNNAIVREVCVCFSKIFMAKKAAYKPFYVRTMENLIETIKLHDTKVSTSAKQAGMCFIKNCPDRTACTLMKMIRDGCCDKHNANLRCASFEYVNYYLFALAKSFDDKKAVFWEYLETALKSGIGDGDPTVRDLAYAALAKTEMVNRKLADKYTATLKKTRKDKYDAIKKEELRRIQSNKGFKTKPSRRRIKSYTPTSSSPTARRGGDGMALGGFGSPAPKRNPRSPRTPTTPNNKNGHHNKPMTFAKATKLLQKEKAQGYKINKRPKDDKSDGDEKPYQKQKLRLEKRRSVNEERERAEREERERIEREKAAKLAKQKEQKRRSRELKSQKEFATAKKLELERLEQEEQAALKRLEKIRMEKSKVKKHEDERKRRMEAEAKQFEFEKKEKERLEKWRADKLAKLEKDRIENERKQKIERQRLQTLEREQREMQQRQHAIVNANNNDRDRIQREKREKEEKAQQERMRRAAQERIQRENERQAMIKKQAEHNSNNSNNNNNNNNNDNNNDFGFPNVHKAATAYFDEKGVHCQNSTHLVLYAKKKGIGGISFAKVSRYFKAKKGK